MHIGPLTIIFGALSVAVLVASALRPRMLWNGHSSVKMMRSALGEGGTTLVLVMIAMLLAGVGFVLSRS